MKMVARLLVGCCLLVLVAGYEGCNDGTVLLGDSTCSDFVQRRANPVIEIDGYEQHWELLPDDRISARMRMGYTVRSGSASRGFKSITDDADSIDVDSLDVRGPDGPLSWETSIDQGNYRMVTFYFPGGALNPEDGTFMVEVKYTMRNAQCRNDLEEVKREEFDAQWANIWQVPVSNIVYSFQLPAGEWKDNSPRILEPTGLTSSPTYTTPPGKGPRIEYAFSSAELNIGRDPNSIVFAWERLGSDPAVDDLRSCNAGTLAGLLFLLFLLLLIPIGCCCAFFLCKKKPPPVNTGGGGYPNQAFNNQPVFPQQYPQQYPPQYPPQYDPQGQIPMAQNAWAGPGQIPMATPADEPPPYEVAANLPVATPGGPPATSGGGKW